MQGKWSQGGAKIFTMLRGLIAKIIFFQYKAPITRGFLFMGECLDLDMGKMIFYLSYFIQVKNAIFK